MPYSTDFYGARSHPHVENALLVDLKRMNDPVDHFHLETFKMNIKYRFCTSLLGPHQPLYLTGPNYDEFLLKVKNEFDPKWRSHPPVPLAHDVFVERAPRMHHMKDRESPDDFME